MNFAAHLHPKTKDLSERPRQGLEGATCGLAAEVLPNSDTFCRFSQPFFEPPPRALHLHA